MKMDSVQELLSDPLKGTKRALDIPCYLFREVLLWRKINQRTWNRRQEAFFEKPHNKNNQDKGNLNKALKSDTMNWPAFKKAIDFLNPVYATLEVKLTWSDDRVSSYLIIVDPTEDEAVLTVNKFPWQDCAIFANAKPAATLMTHLFRHIVATEGKDKPDVKAWWDKLYDDYTKNPVNVVGLDQKEINKTVNTLRRSLLDPRVSWNNFRRGIHLLHPKREEYILTLQWTDDPALRKTMPDSVHAITVDDPYCVREAADDKHD
ncbi:hypothetical protein D3C78_1237460 [compost metagenome]